MHAVSRRLLLIAVFTLALAAHAGVSRAAEEHAIPAGIQKITSVEGITEYELDNGLKLLLFPDPSKSTVTVNITYLVGSRHEGYGESGMAHLLEHLVFKGTPRFPNIPQELTARGARPNGTTWYDRTNYFATFTANDENLRWALDLESDRMVNSFISAEDLQSEFSVVRNEFESGENDPGGVLLERVMSTAYLWHNYGKSTIGSRADIERVPIENLRAFYQKYYQPDNAVLTIAGRFDPAKTLNWVNEFFSKLPRPERALPQTYTIEPVQDGERHVTLRRVGDVQITAAGFHIPPGGHPDFAAAQILAEVLTNEPSGRLYKALVEAGLASSVGSFAFSLKDPGYMYIAAEVLKDKSLDAATSSLLAVTDGFKSAPVTAEEVDRARNRFLKFFEQTYNNSDRVGRGLSEYIAKGDWRLWFHYRDQLEKVTADDVNRVALQYLKPANRTTGVFLPDANPDRSEVPQAPDPKELLAGYQGKAVIAAGEEFDPSPSNILARTRSEALPGGAQLSLLSKTTRGNEVTATLTLRLGSLDSLRGKASVASFTAAMLRRGTTSRSLQQLNDELDRLKSSVSIGGSGQTVSVSLLSTRDNLLPTLELVTDMLRNPAFPEGEFTKLRDEWLASIEQSRSDPQSLAIRELSQRLSPYPEGDFRRTLSFDDEKAELMAVELTDLKQFHADYYGATRATAAVVGDFEETTTRAALGALLANWQAPMKFERASERFFDVPGAETQILTPDKANAFMVAQLNLPLRDDHPDYPALVIANYMLGGGFLNSRLAVRIRQQEGISYGVGSFLNASPLDEDGSFGVFAIYNPENSARLLAALREELAKVIATGFSANELRDAQTGWLQGRNLSRSQDRELMGRLASYLYLQRTLEWDQDFEQRVAALTADEVQAAFVRWITPESLSIIEAGDFATASAQP
ncbi:MAG: insulinase family protein [Gammaproteobacteria bacterium]|nr:insulinase family protein [Gammaproteobacteria bacterium]